jgi:hypothetical protein
MRNGKRSGQGIFYFIDGRIYKGALIDDEI